MTRVAVVRFPGSNCDADTFRAAAAAGGDPYYVWHRSRDLGNAEAVILPGGFAFGDYLRAGAIARFSPVMQAVQEHAAAGGPVLGICNGFQVLCEAGLLPGALVPNAGRRFLSRPVRVRVEATETPFTAAYTPGAVVRMPIAHGHGRYVAPPDVLGRLEEERQVVLRYEGDNPNDSLHAIAGVCNAGRNVVGMMPHPERAVAPELGHTEGILVFRSLSHTAHALEGGTP